MRGEEARSGEGGGKAYEERPEHCAPGVRLELPRLELGVLEGAIGRAQDSIEMGARALRSEAPLRGEGGSHRRQPSVGGEGDQRLLMLRLLLLGAEEGAQEP